MLGVALNSKTTNVLGQIFSVIIGLSLLAAIGWFLWLLFTRFLTFLESANPSVAAAVIGGMATVFVGLAVTLYTQSQSKKREIEEAHRERKVAIYRKYLDVVSGVMSTQNPKVTKKGLSEQELIDFMVEFKSDIILWGSPKVIKAHLSFEKTAQESGNVLLAVDKFYRAIRKDIGLSNRGLSRNELVKMYLKDPSELDTMSTPNKALQRTGEVADR